MDHSIIPATLGRVIPTGPSRRERRTDGGASFRDSLQGAGDEEESQRGTDASDKKNTDPEPPLMASLAHTGESDVGTRLDMTA